MANLTKTALTKLTTGNNNVMYRINGKAPVFLSPEGAKLILDKFPEAKDEIYSSPRAFTKAMRDCFGANWRVTLAK